MAKKTPKSNPATTPARLKGTQRPSSNPTKKGEIFGKWQPPRKGGK